MMEIKGNKIILSESVDDKKFAQLQQQAKSARIEISGPVGETVYQRVRVGWNYDSRSAVVTLTVISKPNHLSDGVCCDGYIQRALQRMKILLPLVLAGVSFGQNVASTPVDKIAYPSYFVAVGEGYIRNNNLPAYVRHGCLPSSASVTGCIRRQP